MLSTNSSSIVLLSAGLLCAGAARAAPASPAKALRLLREGRLDEAARMLRAAFEAEPKSAALATDLGFAEQLRGQPAEAERLFRQAIALDGRRWYAYANLASMKAASPLSESERDGLIRLLERGLSLQPREKGGQAGLLLAMAEVERAAGNFAAARARSAQTSALRPGGAQARRLQAVVQSIDAAEARRGEPRAALSWPEPAIEDALQARLGAAERALAHDPSSALREAEALSAQHRSWRAPRWLKARALLALEQLEAGTRELESLLRLDPRDAAAWRLLGETLANQGGPLEAERADAALERALALEPAWIELWGTRGRLLSRLGRNAEARAALERESRELSRAGESLPDDQRALLAAVEAKSGLTDSAAAGMTDVVPSMRAMLREAQALADSGDRADAGAQLDRLLADSPGFIDAAVLRWSLENGPLEGAAQAHWNDAAALLRLAAAARAEATAQALRAAAEPELERADAGGSRGDAGAGSPDAGAADAGAVDERARFEPEAIAALVRPWIWRAAELGSGSALLQRAALEAEGGDGGVLRDAGALEDLGAAIAAGLSREEQERALHLRDTLERNELIPDAGGAAGRGGGEISGAASGDSNGPCDARMQPALALERGEAREAAGELEPARACYRAALESRDRDAGTLFERDGVARGALERLARADERAEVGSLAADRELLAAAEAAQIAAASLADARWLAAEGRDADALAALDRFEESPRRPGFPEPGERQARALRASLEKEQERAGARLRNRALWALGAIAIALLAALAIAFRGLPVEAALRRDASLFPAIGRAVAEVRHDALKHRASVLAMSGSAPREEIARAMLEPRAASMLIADAFAPLVKAAESRGLKLRAVGRDPAFGPLFTDLRRAEALLAQPLGPREPEIAAIAARIPEHAERLSALLKLGPRTRLDAQVLSRWIGAVEAGLRAQGQPWSSPALELQGLELDFPLASEALESIFANLLRNAEAAAHGSGEPRVRVRVSESRDAAGRRLLELRVGDSSDAPLSLEQFESRESGRGLSLVRDLTREWQGQLRVVGEPSPLRKSVALAFPGTQP